MIDRRKALLLGGVSAVSLLGLACTRKAPIGESSSAIDWPSFLQDWNAQARRALAAMLIKHGVAGPPAFGVKRYVDAEIAKTGGAVPADVLSPIAGSISTAGGVDALLRDARERLQRLAQHVDLRGFVSYEWEVIRNDGLFHSPGNQGLLAEAEQRLGVTLPPSFRAYVLASNGWLSASSKLIPLQHVVSFGQADRDYVQDWSITPPIEIPDERYFAYGDTQEPRNIRTRYLPDCLLISQPLSEINERLLLNPQVRFDNQELETWLMSPRLPGAIRYRSFTELMRFMQRSDEAAWRRLSD
jgi:hypothetical protein